MVSSTHHRYSTASSTSASEASTSSRGLQQTQGRSPLPSQKQYGRPEPANVVYPNGTDHPQVLPSVHRGVAAATVCQPPPSSPHQTTPQKFLSYTIERRPSEQETIQSSAPSLFSQSEDQGARRDGAFARRLYASSLPRRQTVTVDTSASPPRDTQVAAPNARPEPRSERHSDPSPSPLSIGPEPVGNYGNVYGANVLVLSPASSGPGNYQEQDDVHVISPDSASADYYFEREPSHPPSEISTSPHIGSTPTYSSSPSATESRSVMSNRRSSTRLNGPRQPSTRLRSLAEGSDTLAQPPSQEEVPSYSLVDHTPPPLNSVDDGREIEVPHATLTSLSPTRHDTLTPLSRAPTYYLVDPRSSMSSIRPQNSGSRSPAMPSIPNSPVTLASPPPPSVQRQAFVSPNHDPAIHDTPMEQRRATYDSSSLSRNRETQCEIRSSVIRSSAPASFVQPDRRPESGHHQTDGNPIFISEYYSSASVVNDQRAYLSRKSSTLSHVPTIPSPDRHHSPPLFQANVDSVSSIPSYNTTPPPRDNKLRNPPGSRINDHFAVAKLESLQPQHDQLVTAEGVYQLPLYHETGFPAGRVDPMRRPRQPVPMHHHPPVPSEGVYQLPVYHMPTYQDTI